VNKDSHFTKLPFQVTQL